VAVGWEAEVAEVAVGWEAEVAEVAVAVEPVEPVVVVGVAASPPHAESIMARTIANGATCRVIRLVIFIVVLFLLGKVSWHSHR